jgi:hypothetical protein
MLGLGISIPEIAIRGSGGGFDPATVTLINYLTAQGVPPSGADQTAYNNFIVGLKSAGIWSLFDVIYLFAAADQTAALVNLVNPGTFNATTVSSLTFTAYQGFTSNGTSSYVTSNFTPSSQGVNYTLNSASIAARSLTAAGAANNNHRIVGRTTNDGTGRPSIIAFDTGSVYGSAINSASVNESSTDSSSQGLYQISRNGSTVSRYKGGSSIGDITVPSVSLPGSAVTFCADPGSSVFSTLQIASGALGAALTSTQAASYNTVENAYMTAVGA